MIETTDAQAEKAAKIVLAAMSRLDAVMCTYGITTAIKIDCANAIARLAAALDTRPHVLFGDINTMDDDVEKER